MARPHVTVFCGFLGAGKTTLLNHLLKQAEGRRWAAVVNDVAAINIDAAVVQSTQGESGDVVELGNGCVCCSSRDELGETVARLAATGDYAHILVETTGVAEPRGIAALFLQRNVFGRSLNDFAELSSLVSVVDAAFFLNRWREAQARGGARVPVEGATRPVFELMIEQVECADLLVLNKADLVEETALAELEAIVRGLNPRAEIVRTEHGQLSAELVLERVRFDSESTLKAATWIRVMNTLVEEAGQPSASGEKESGGEASAAHVVSSQRGTGRLFVQKPGGAPLRAEVPQHERRFGIRSFVFQARRPFDRAKLEALFDRGVPGLLRAKGFLWIGQQPDEMGFLSFAGGVLRVDFLNYWWAALVESGKVGRADVPAKLDALWQEPHGERRQELVFIGVDLNEPALRAALNDCLEDPRGQ